MPVLKSNRTATLAGGAIVLDLADLKRQGDRILAGAREEAAAIVEAARAEADRLVSGAAERGYAEGRERGWKDGHEAGQAAGREEAATALRDELNRLQSSWTGALESWSAEREAMLLEARRDVLDFALALGERILRRAIEVEPDRVIDQVEGALSLMIGQSKLRLAIHPEDRPLLESAMPAIIERVGGDGHVELVEDREVERGGCRASGSDGSVDATIRTQVDRVVATLLPGRRRDLVLEPPAEEETGS